MFFVYLMWLLVFLGGKFGSSEWIEFYTNDSGLDNPYLCQDMKKCVVLKDCPEIGRMMNELSLPVHRFRQMVCGYMGKTPKICCDSPFEVTNPGPTNYENGKYNNQCGTSLIKSNVHTLGSHPYVARIGFINVNTGEIKYPCAGAIIDRRNILTTATCALAKSSEYKLNQFFNGEGKKIRFSILLGDYDTSSDPDCNSLFCGHKARNYDISYVIKHPDFHADTFQNNIALLRLKNDIDYSMTIQPICLSSTKNIQNQNAVLVGWGEILNMREKPFVQQSLNMTLLPMQECSKFINRGLSVELCAAGQLEPCSGFSGSALIQKYDDSFVLIGLLSYGASCAEPFNYPSAYVDVQKYSNWIRQNSL